MTTSSALPQTLIVIPARLAASRLPRKPLADIHGQPMIVHVWQRAVAAGLGPVVVAAGDAEIAKVVTAAGGEAVLTDPACPSGSDRVFAAVEQIDPAGRFEVVINLQGDLPTIAPHVIESVLHAVDQPDIDIGTAVSEISDPQEIADPNVVKAATAFPPGESVAPVSYFSRAPVPFGDGPYYHHIGLYAWRREALARFVTLPENLLEKRERLEQLRAMAVGMRVAAALVDTIPLGVDTPADLERIRTLLRPAE